MAPSFFTLGAAALAYTAGVAAVQTYQLSDSYNSGNFFDKWNFIETTPSSPDTSNGFVNYLSRDNANSSGLIAVQGTEVFIGVDHGTNLTGVPTLGRSSVRIESKTLYNHGLFIADFFAMPHGCGVWPAYWTVSATATWPDGGEIDIIGE